ncbi:MAG TPA: leucine-rich repeat protein [Ruminococcus sp.]|nr:leucine-rich repeat protein [Ruminococcus sp.]
MSKKRTMMKFAALLSAVALTAGIPTAMQKSVLSAAPITAYAEEQGTQGKSGPLTYMKYSDHVEITTSDMSATSVEIPSSIDGVPVTVIGIYAFNGSSIQSVKIPDTVTEIGHWAFCMCDNLTSVTIPDSVQKIGIRAFEHCPKLTTVNFPDHLIEMSSLVFDDTPWIEEQRKKDPLVVVNGALIDAQAAKGDIVIPSGIKYVSPSAFARNKDVTSVVFPSSVDKLCDNVFFYCDNLKSVELNGVTLIDSMSFAYCNKLTDLKISGKLTSIDSRAFSDVTSTATITFYGSQSAWNSVQKPDNDPFLSRANMIFDESHVDPEIIPGDVNADGKFNIADVVDFQKWLLSVQGAELKNGMAGDLCEDNKLDAFDLTLMRQALIYDKN